MSRYTHIPPNLFNSRPSRLTGSADAWQSWVDALTRPQRDYLYPGMHREVIPLYERVMGEMEGEYSESISPGSNSLFKSQPADTFPGINTEIDIKNMSDDEIEAMFRDGIHEARKRGYNVAAAHLEHYLDGESHALTVSSDWLLRQPAIIDAVNVNLDRFQYGDAEKSKPGRVLEAMIKLRSGQSTSVSDYWVRLVDVSDDNAQDLQLYYAAGDSTLTSTGTFKLTKGTSGAIEAEGEIVHDWTDKYDFHRDWVARFVSATGVITLPDEAALRLERAERAHPFEMSSQWKQSHRFSS